MEGSHAPGLLLAASLGLASALHCLGMCGGFSLLVAGREPGRWRAMRALARFHAGRLLVYAFLGSVAGALGTQAVELGLSRRALAIAGGAALVLTALPRLAAPAGLAPIARRLRVAGLAAGLARLSELLRALASRRDGTSLLLFGAANGFLPCAATAAGLALAVAAGGAAGGAASMLAFGAATTPALLLLGWAGTRVPIARVRGPLLARAAAAVTLLVGIATLWRSGLLPDSSCCSVAQ